MKEKAYIINDDENTFMGVVKTKTRSKAVYECWKAWDKDLGLNLLEFSKLITCCRYKGLDDLNFSYLDGRDLDSEEDELSLEILMSEIN